MTKSTVKFLLLILVLLAPIGKATGKTVRAFVVTNEADTILGEIRLSSFNQATGAFFITGFEQEALHYEVWFRPVGKKRFKQYAPNDLRLYTFSYKGQTYEYRKFSMLKRNINAKKRQQDRFLLLIHSSKVKLYKDVIREPYRKPHEEIITSYYHFSDYYLFNEKNGLVKVKPDKERTSILDLLSWFDLEEEFLNLLPKHSNFKDVSSILSHYIDWCKMAKT